MKLTVRRTFLVVYISISVATFYHSAWGFATLQGAMPDSGPSLFIWWGIGALSAFAVDVGMGAIVYALISGWEARWLQYTLYVLGFASAFTQIIYAAHHAASYPLGIVPNWLAWLGYVLDARTIILPILLPAFAVTYAFAAKIKEPSKLPNDIGLTENQFKVLQYVIENDETTRKDIYTEFNKSPSFATIHIKKLSDLGLVIEEKGKLTASGAFQ